MTSIGSIIAEHGRDIEILAEIKTEDNEDPQPSYHIISKSALLLFVFSGIIFLGIFIKFKHIFFFSFRCLEL